jgi:hypothetical protein
MLAVAIGFFVTPKIMGSDSSLLGLVAGMVGQVGERLEAEDAPARQLSNDEGDFRWVGRLAEGRTIEIKGVNGAIEAVAASGSEVVVSAEKAGRRSDPAEVRIEVVEHSDGVTVCAVYPSADGRNECAPGEGGRSSVRNNDTRVTFRVEVPAGVKLRARTVNGTVEGRDLDGDVDAETVNGDVEIETGGFARARTVNGSIHASMGRWDGDGADFSTVNGSIELDVPDDLNARLEARWVNGSLESSIPMMLQGRIGRRSASALFGDGGGELRLETVNGSIRIR